jgi:hypothetical protein
LGPSDVNFCVEDCECNLMASISKKITDQVKAKKCFWTFFIFLVMSKVSKELPIQIRCARCAHLQFYLPNVAFQWFNWVRTWFVIKVPFSHKNKGHKKICKDIPKVRTKHFDHKYCMPSSSTRPISRCYNTLQWILWRTFANRIDLSSLKSNWFLYKQLKPETTAISTILVCCRKYRSSVVPQFCVPRMKSISENKSIPVAYTCQIRVSDMQCVFLWYFPRTNFVLFFLNPKNWEIFGFKNKK